jgi:threonine synthase
MYSLQDANIFNIAIRGMFDDCQDIVKSVSNDAAFKEKYKIGAVNSINWARVAAQIVYYFKGYFAATRSNDEQVAFAVPSGNFGNICAGHVARMMGLPIAQAGAGHQRERRARRVLPHRRLSAAGDGRDARHLEPVDGHLEGLQLRALRLRPGRARRGVVREWWAKVDAGGGFDLRGTPYLARLPGSASSRAPAATPTGWRRSAPPGRSTA